MFSPKCILQDEMLHQPIFETHSYLLKTPPILCFFMILRQPQIAYSLEQGNKNLEKSMEMYLVAISNNFHRFKYCGILQKTWFGSA